MGSTELSEGGDYYLFPNDYNLIKNDGKRYPVPDIDIDLEEWLKQKLIEKKICREDILSQHGELSPFFSAEKDGVAYYGENKKEYNYLHQIKNEDGQNYLYRVWLQYLYDEMVLGKRSPRVLRLASYGEEYDRSQKKWNELADFLQKHLVKMMAVDNVLFTDILFLSKYNEQMKIFAQNDEKSGNSMLGVISKECIKTLISSSQIKTVTEWSVYQKMKREEINDWFDQKRSDGEVMSNSDFKKKNDLIKYMVESHIEPPGFDDIRSNIIRCFPNPIFINNMVRVIESNIYTAVKKLFRTDKSIANIEINIGKGSKVNSQDLRLKLERLFSKDNPEIGKRKNGWTQFSLKRRIERTSELLTYEILRILVCELEWITLEVGDYGDIEEHYDFENDDTIARRMKSSNKVPTMIYFTQKLNRMIPDGAGPQRKKSAVYLPEKHGNEEHSIFRFMSHSTKRWSYCEPAKHYPGKEGGFIYPTSRISILGEKKYRKLQNYNIKINKSRSWDKPWPKRTQIGKKVCDALNSLQKTQWEVNFDLLERITDGFKIVNDEVEYNQGNDKISLQKFIHDRLYSEFEYTDKMPEFLKEEIRKELIVKRKEITDTLASCFKAIRNGDNVFWHPWACDYRGRLNTVSNFLSPQGNDLSKAIIRFKEWKPIGDKGSEWFKVHVCNLLSSLDFTSYFSKLDKNLEWEIPSKQNKKSFQTRIKWTEKHLDCIIHICENLEEEEVLEILEFNISGLLKPKNELFQRVAVMLEFHRVMKEFEAKGDWNEVKSGMPIHLDASCNGFQHAAALLENKDLAKKVNLLKPDDYENGAEDLYMEIADLARIEFEKGSKGKSSLWKYIHKNLDKLNLDNGTVESIGQIFTRNLVKRPTLAVGYGASDKSKYFGIISGKEGAPPSVDSFSDSDWNYLYKFNEIEDKKEYEKMGFKRPRKNKKNCLVNWIESRLPKQETSEIKGKSNFIDLLIENKVAPPSKYVCKHANCKKEFDSVSMLKSHVKLHKSVVWHPNSPLFLASPSNVKDKISNKLWPSNVQQDFAKSVTSDIKNAIDEVTGNSFDEIGRKRLKMVQRELFEHEPTPHEGGKFTSWSVFDSDGLELNYYVTKKGDAKNIDRSLSDVKTREILERVYFNLHGKEKLDIDHILEKEKLLGEENPHEKLGKILLKQLLSKRDKIEPGRDLDKLKILNKDINDIFKIAYTFNVDREENIVLDKDSIKSGITANFVHSLDAAHMREVINAMAEKQIDSIWAVHDSFGTHAADIEDMREIIKEEFYNLHQGKSINWWCKQMNSNWKEDESINDCEKFDIKDVLESEFIVG